MVRIKLENLGLARKSASEPAVVNTSHDKSGVGAVTDVMLNAPGSLAKGALTVGNVVGDGVGNILNTGLTGVFSLGKGFRDFILRGTVVELAVAVVLGTAFTNLISAATSDWILPLIGAIFQGTRFTELYFTVNYSQFNYGHFINEFLVFLLVCMILYLGVVVPLNKLQYAAFKHKAILRDCPRCLEEISMAATRCKFCCADIEVEPEVKAVLEMAEAAMEAEAKKQNWCWKMLTCCVKPKTAVIESTPDGDLQLKEVQVSTPDEVLSAPQSTLRTRFSHETSQSARSGDASSPGASPSQLSPAVSMGSPAGFHSPRSRSGSSFVTASSSPGGSFTAGGSTSIDIARLQQQLKANCMKHK